MDRNFLDQLRQQTSLRDLIGRYVQWDRKKSEEGRGILWACCPFHQEKSASFKVDVGRGQYYCFGCHKKGDAISFLQDRDGLGFVEAVRQLADMAGLAIPETDLPKGPDSRPLYRAMDVAQEFFVAQLKGRDGVQARSYLVRQRGLSPDDAKHFGIGFAPNSWDMLVGALEKSGVSMADAEAVGLVSKSDRGQGYYSRFRGRVMFPIHDARGRLVAFGGRLLEGEGAKYYNSTETAIFSKKKTLYNLHQARTQGRKDDPMIVVEGYMDCVALHKAGFGRVVAPMGTAMNEEHLQELWKYNSEPVVCLDGDKAGLNAADRLVAMALPLVRHDKTLQFITLPDGLDPDDYIKHQGRDAFSSLLSEAQPLADFCWLREYQRTPLHTPEQIEGLKTRLRMLLQTMTPGPLREGYKQHMQQKLQDHGLLTSPRPARPLRKPVLPAMEKVQHNREYLLLGLLLGGPQLLEEVVEQLSELTCINTDLEKLRIAMMECVSSADDSLPLDATMVARHLTGKGLRDMVQSCEDVTRMMYPGLEEMTPEDIRTHWKSIAKWQQQNILHQRLDDLKLAVAEHGLTDEILGAIEATKLDLQALDD